MVRSQKTKHAIMIPIPLQGHINPFIQLAYKLASNGFTITFVITQSVHHHITTASQYDDVFTEARNSGLDIQYETVSDGLPVEFDRSGNEKEFWKSVEHVFPKHVEECIGKLRNPKPSCLITDTFYVWPAALADKYGLVNVSLWTQSALAFGIYSHLDMLLQHPTAPLLDDEGKDVIDYIPGVQCIQTKDLVSHIRGTEKVEFVENMSYKAFKQLKSVDFILFNTIQEFEQDTLIHLSQKYPIYTIGPILHPDFTNTNVTTSLWAETDCTHWLNAKPRGSVLYVSFGSYAHMTKRDISEIAHGLLLSEVNFIWAIRPGILTSNENDILPNGFEHSVKDRGLVVPWCNQTCVLKHSAVGGFLTHCGWNSTLESIWCGVPVICFPLTSDQFSNRKLIVDDWKIGLNLYDAESLTREAVLAKINYVMMGESSFSEHRDNMKKMRKRLHNAFQINGSSRRNFSHFLQDMEVKIQE